ncbi:MAG: hypothetical protein K9G58_06060 [Bacteroidales bacterium]|nr:hypothetical protein [Bacteroidales bacterium]MCF8397711.1 hypothetical protein [Bacteroidales bacterium]
MKWILSYTVAFLFFIYGYGQEKKDYQEFVKEKVETSSGFDNYTNLISFGNDIHILDAEDFVGKNLTDSQHRNLLIYAVDIYLTSKMNNLLVEVIRCIDL